MSRPFKLPFVILQGQDLDDVFVWKAGMPPVPVDLTGCSARMQVRPRADSPDVLLELSTDNGRLALGGTSGEIRRLISAADTAALTWRAGVYDLEIVHGNGQVRRLMEGPARVDPEVTRNA